MIFSGVHHQRAQVHDEGCLTDSEAEVYTVIGRNSSAMLVGLQDDSYFMLWHKKFESLEYLLTSDVSLYAIDSNYAYFVKIPKGIDIFNTEDHPFMFKAQQDNAEEVIVITVDKLLRLSKRLRKPSCSLTFLVHSTRCGSTALCQMFNALPGWRAIAETAFPVKYLYDMRYKHGKSVTDLAYCDKFYDVAEACIRMYVKDFEPQLNILFKTIGITEFFMIPFISKRFPESHIISAHRSGLGTAKSSYQVFYDMALNMVLPTIWNRHVSYNLFWGDVSRIILLMSSGMGEEFERHLMSGPYRDCFYLHYVRWNTNSLLYLKYYGDANPGKLTCVNFEDLMSDKQGTLSQVGYYLPMNVCITNKSHVESGFGGYWALKN